MHAINVNNHVINMVIMLIVLKSPRGFHIWKSPNSQFLDPSASDFELGMIYLSFLCKNNYLICQKYSHGNILRRLAPYFNPWIFLVLEDLLALLALLTWLITC